MSPEKLTAPAMPASRASEIAHAGPAATDGFLQRPFVQNILPFLTSLSLHSAILIIGLLTYTAVQIIRQQPMVSQVTPADTALMNDAGLPDFVGNADKPWRTQQDQIPDSTTNGDNFTRGSKELRATGGGASGESASLLVVGPGTFGRSGTIGNSTGPGNGPGDVNGATAMWGAPQPGGVKNPVFGPPGAHRIAYVCDASGSMINKMASLKMELAKAVVSLGPTQSFSIVFFQDRAAPQMLDRALLPATPMNKRRAGGFLENVTSAGSTDPIPGIEAAFRQQPELVYLLTDGDFQDNDGVLAKIRELNKGKNKVRVNTIAFVSSNDNDTAFIDLLKTIAKENGGTYRHVSEEDLN